MDNPTHRKGDSTRGRFKMNAKSLEELKKAIKQHPGQAVAIGDLSPKGLPHPGGIVAGSGIYYPDGSVMDLKTVESHKPGSNSPTPLKTTRGDETLRQRVLGRWRG